MLARKSLLFHVHVRKVYTQCHDSRRGSFSVVASGAQVHKLPPRKLKWIGFSSVRKVLILRHDLSKEPAT